MNGFSTEEDSHDGPPAPPFYGQSCCLIEDGERCGRSAGNASFSKRIQKSISQKKLKLEIDKCVSVNVAGEGGGGSRLELGFASVLTAVIQLAAVSRLVSVSKAQQ